MTTLETLPEMTTLETLPKELINTIALNVKDLHAFCVVVPFDLENVAGTKVLRAVRAWLAVRSHSLSVGDRVLYRPAAKDGRRICYATADGKIADDLWKLELLDGTSVQATTHRTYVLPSWADISSDIQRATHAAAIASRRAATQANEAAVALLRSPLVADDSAEAQLALAAASAASLAAAAATMAAHVAEDSFPNGSTLCGVTEESPVQEGAHGLATHVQQTLDKQNTTALHRLDGELVPTTPPGKEVSSYIKQELTPAELTMKAALAAATASAEASVATHAAGTVTGLPVSSASAATTRSAAGDVMAAAQKLLNDEYSDTGASAGEILRVAAGAIEDVWAAERRQSAACAAEEYSSSTVSGAKQAALIDTHRAAAAVADAASAASMKAVDETASIKAVNEAAAAADTDRKFQSHLLQGCRELSPPAGLEGNIDSLLREGHCVLWCWFPRSTNWTEYQLLERSTRAVAACRSNDIIALPDHPLVHELVMHWCETDYGTDRVTKSNVIWYDPLLACPVNNPARATLDFVLQTYHLSHSRPNVLLYLMYVEEGLRDMALANGLGCLGDCDEHKLIGSLGQAKSFLHSKLGDPLAPCLADAALGREVRGPRGYCVKTAGELLEAWQHA